MPCHDLLSLLFFPYPSSLSLHIFFAHHSPFPSTDYFYSRSLFHITYSSYFPYPFPPSSLLRNPFFHITYCSYSPYPFLLPQFCALPFFSFDLSVFRFPFAFFLVLILIFFSLEALFVVTFPLLIQPLFSSVYLPPHLSFSSYLNVSIFLLLCIPYLPFPSSFSSSHLYLPLHLLP